MQLPHANPLLDRAIAVQQSGQLAESEQILRQVLAQNPNDPEALHQLGLIAFRTNHASAAVELIARAIAIDPSNPAFHGNLGFVYKAMGRLDQTIACFQAAAALLPKLPEAHFNLAAALEENRQWEQAIVAYRAALAQKPDFPEALNNLANCLNAVGRADEAIAACRTALDLRPDFPQATKTLASALAQKGRFEDSLQLCQQVLTTHPDDAPAHYQAGSLLLELRRPWEAIEQFRVALALRPGFVPAQWNLAFALLLSGKLREGFAAYEARHSLDFFHHTFTQPMWDGSDLAGRRILIHPEKGNFFGEVIQFARYAPLVAARGGTVLLECQPELQTLLSTLPGVLQVIALGEPLPPFDVHCSLMSLASRFETTLETIPWSGPYLHADSTKVEHWRQKLATDANAFKVGIVWAGRPLPAGRSIDFHLLAPLMSVEGTQFYGLQKDGADRGGGPADPLRQAQDRPLRHAQDRAPLRGVTDGLGLHLIDLGPHLHDFSDTAAVLMNLDLLITIDTSVAHLAGALGRPAWLLLRHAADWRWLMDRDDSPWYPSLRLFRQPAPGDWASVIGHATRALDQRIGATGRG